MVLQRYVGLQVLQICAKNTVSTTNRQYANVLNICNYLLLPAIMVDGIIDMYIYFS